MRNIRLGLVFIFIFLVIAPIPILTVLKVQAKTTNIEASGTVVTTQPFTVTGFRTADGNEFITGAFTDDVFEGTFVGTASNVFSSVLNPSGMVVKLYFTFSGTVAGRSGTCIIQFQGNGEGIGLPIKGTWVILSGTGELTNLHGQLSVEGIAGEILYYSGQIHFDH